MEIFMDRSVKSAAPSATRILRDNQIAAAGEGRETDRAARAVCMRIRQLNTINAGALPGYRRIDRAIQSCCQPILSLNNLNTGKTRIVQLPQSLIEDDCRAVAEV